MNYSWLLFGCFFFTESLTILTDVVANSFLSQSKREEKKSPFIVSCWNSRSEAVRAYHIHAFCKKTPLLLSAQHVSELSVQRWEIQFFQAEKQAPGIPNLYSISVLALTQQLALWPLNPRCILEIMELLSPLIHRGAAWIMEFVSQCLQIATVDSEQIPAIRLTSQLIFITMLYC